MTAVATPDVPRPLRLLGSVAWHPLLFAVYPALVLWAANVSEATPGDVWPAIWLPVLIAVGLWAAMAAATWSVRRGAIVASLVVAVALNGGRVGLHLNVVVGVMTFWAIGVAVILIRRLEDAPLVGVTAMANVLAAVMVVFTLPTIVGQWGPTAGSPVAAAAVSGGLAGRDIWYIIPDRYPRMDTLAEQYDFDNSPFLSHLEDIGFQVAEHAMTNYPKTAHSLAATWNFESLDTLIPEPPDDETDWQPLYRLLRDSALARTITEAGYEYTHLGTWWSPTSTSTSADVVLRADDDSEFVTVYRTQTAWPVSSSDDGSPSLRERNRHYTDYQYTQLDRLATDPHDEPRFVLAHITQPHGPYVFAEDGSLLTREQQDALPEDENFLNQLRYLNSRLTTLIDQLTSGPESTWPVIVIQSDEGPNPAARQGNKYFDFTTATDAELQRKMRTLSAILLPDSDVVLPEDLTGINTWRIVLDAVIGTNLGMVDDPVEVFPGERFLYTLVDVRDRVY